MAVPEAEVKKVLDKAFADTRHEIEQRHAAYGWRMWGWAKNKWAHTMALSGASKTHLGVKVLSVGLKQIPVVGPFLSFPVNELADFARRKYLTKQVMPEIKDPAEKLQLTGEFMVVKGAEAIADAARKVLDAHKVVEDLVKKDQMSTNCEVYLNYLYAVLYFEYRVSRLDYYVKLMNAFTESVALRLTDMQKDLPSVEETARKAGMERIGQFWYHFEHCKQNPACLYPEEWLKYLEISGPTNVKLPEGLNLQNLRPIQPLGQKPVPPPLPPRPNFGRH